MSEAPAHAQGGRRAQVMWRRRVVRMIAAGLMFYTSGCGTQESHTIQGLGSESARDSFESTDGTVVKGRALFTVGMDSGFRSRRAQLSAGGGQIPLVAVNNASVTGVFDTAEFSLPALRADVLSLGYLKFTALEDNDLNCCGSDGKRHCNQAVIRMYTINQPGPGFWNADAQKSAPLKAGIADADAEDEGNKLKPVGHTARGAVDLQTASLSPQKHVFRLEDFWSEPRYELELDLREYTPGAYSMTIVVEYGLR